MVGGPAKKRRIPIVDPLCAAAPDQCAVRGVVRTGSKRRAQEAKKGQIYLYMRNFIGGLFGASEILLTPRKTTV